MILTSHSIGRRIVNLQTSLALLNQESGVVIPPDLHNREPFRHPAADLLPALTEQSRLNSTNRNRMARLADTFGLMSVLRWRPRKVGFLSSVDLVRNLLLYLGLRSRRIWLRTSSFTGTLRHCRSDRLAKRRRGSCQTRSGTNTEQPGTEMMRLHPVLYILHRWSWRGFYERWSPLYKTIDIGNNIPK